MKCVETIIHRQSTMEMTQILRILEGLSTFNFLCLGLFQPSLMTSIINEVIQQPPLDRHACYQWQYVISTRKVLSGESWQGGPHCLLYLYYNLLYIYIHTYVYKIYIYVGLSENQTTSKNPLVNPHFPIQLTISWVKNASIHLDPTGEAATLSSWSPQKLPSFCIAASRKGGKISCNFHLYHLYPCHSVSIIPFVSIWP